MLNKEYITEHKLTEEEMYQIFEEPDYLIEADQYTLDPSNILGSSDLVVCIEDQLYKYADAIQIIISQIVFKQILPIETMPQSLNVFASDYQENLKNKKLNSASLSNVDGSQEEEEKSFEDHIERKKRQRQISPDNNS